MSFFSFLFTTHVALLSDKRYSSFDRSGSIFFNPNLYKVHGQVQSKLIFLKKFCLPNTVRYFFIAHGIGCYMAMQMLNAYPPFNVVQILMISPTIENLHLTQVGSTFKKSFAPFKCSVIDRLVHFYHVFALFYLSWLFGLIYLDRLVLYLYKKIFLHFFGAVSDYSFVASERIPFLVILLEDAVSLVSCLFEWSNFTIRQINSNCTPNT